MQRSIMMVCLGAIAMAMAGNVQPHAPTSPGTIQARKIELVDGQGHVGAVLSCSDDGQSCHLIFKYANGQDALRMGVSKDAASVRLVYPKADSEARNSDAIVLRLVKDRDSPVISMQSYSAEGKKAKGGRMVRTLDNKVTDIWPSTPSLPAAVRGVAPSIPLVYAFPGDHWIEGVIDDGTVLKLEDGSLWQVDAGDEIKSILWLPISDVKVIEDRNGRYRIVNTDDNESVHAKLLHQ
jgi:hypothetical protein